MITLIPHGLIFTGCWISYAHHLFGLAHVMLHCTSQLFTCEHGHVVGVVRRGVLCS